jgi:hypothetical protein
MQTELPVRKARGRLTRDVQNKLGQQLRTVYDDIVNEGVPEHLRKLMERLDDDKGSA